VPAERVTVSERPARKEKFVVVLVLVLVLDFVRGSTRDEDEDEDDSENKNAFIFRKSKMKASTNPAENRSAGWPHPPLCGEAGEWVDRLTLLVDGNAAQRHSDHQPATIHHQPPPTSAIKPIS